MTDPRMSNPATSTFLAQAKKMAIVQEKIAHCTPSNPIPEKLNNNKLHLESLNNIELKNGALLDRNLCSSIIRDFNAEGSSLLLLDLHSTRANRLNANGGNLSFIDLTRSQLPNATFKKATLEFVSFIGADLTDADFSGATANKGVIFIGAHASNTTLPDHAVLRPDQLKEQINTGLYNPEELNFLNFVFEQAAADINESLHSASPVIGSEYLTATHLDHVNQANDYVKAALSNPNSHSNSSKTKP